MFIQKTIAIYLICFYAFAAASTRRERNIQKFEGDYQLEQGSCSSNIIIKAYSDSIYIRNKDDSQIITTFPRIAQGKYTVPSGNPFPDNHITKISLSGRKVTKYKKNMIGRTKLSSIKRNRDGSQLTIEYYSNDKKCTYKKISQEAVASELNSLNTKKITCYFTEPFINLEYDILTEIVTVKYVGLDEAHQVQNVKAQKISSDPYFPQFELNIPSQNDDPALGLTLTFDFQGSDGMSDQRYPISAVYGGDHVIHGGCETDRIQD